METKIFIIDPSRSSVEWVGRKVTGSHNGTVAIAGGRLILVDGELTGGEFAIDMQSIRILDVTELDTNAQFAGHLASEDFFATEQFPIATLEINSVSERIDKRCHIAGELTIRGTRRPIEWDAEVGEIQEDELRASGKLVVDRTKYGMRFRSGNFFKDLGNTLIFNDFTLNVLLTAKAA